MFHLSNLLYIDGHCILFVMIYIESPLTKVLYKYILIAVVASYPAASCLSSSVNCRAANYWYSGFIHLQSLIDAAIIQVRQAEAQLLQCVNHRYVIWWDFSYLLQQTRNIFNFFFLLQACARLLFCLVEFRTFELHFSHMDFL